MSTNPFLASPCFLKVLFRREVKLDRYEHYELVTYSFKEYDYLREKPCRIIDRNIHLSSFRYPLYDRIDYEGLDLDKLEIDIIDVEDNQEEIKKLLHYDVVSLENKNEVVTREHILKTVWGYNVYPSTRTIDNFILTFRKYFEEDSRHPSYFHSIRGVGYKFTMN